MTIRRIPCDFRVEESLTAAALAGLRPRPGPAHGHALYRLTKTSLTTPDAARLLAAAVGAPASAASYAGLKDKHAVCVQHVSLAADPDRAPARAEGRGWSAALLGWASSPIAADAIERNAFTIIVRDLTTAACGTIDRHAALLSPRAGGGLLLINYFGDQRFGSARHGRGFAGARLVRGEYLDGLRLLIATPARKDSGVTRRFTRSAAAHWGDWPLLAAQLPRSPNRRAIEALAGGGSPRDAFAALPHLLQTLAVESYQSYLWNATARRLAAEIAVPNPVAPAGSTPRFIEADDPFGPMRFPHAAEIEPHWLDINLPMFAPATEPAEPWAAAAASALADENLALADLRLPGLRRPAFREAARPLLAAAQNFAASPPEPDELSRAGRLRRTLTFSLPRGAYATVVLRALGQ